MWREFYLQKKKKKEWERKVLTVHSSFITTFLGDIMGLNAGEGLDMLRIQKSSTLADSGEHWPAETAADSGLPSWG